MSRSLFSVENFTTTSRNIWHMFACHTWHVTLVHSTTREEGRFSLRYPTSSLLLPGQLVSSSSSSCLSWIRLERPLEVSWVQPESSISFFHCIVFYYIIYHKISISWLFSDVYHHLIFVDIRILVKITILQRWCNTPEKKYEGEKHYRVSTPTRSVICTLNFPAREEEHFRRKWKSFPFNSDVSK